MGLGKTLQVLALLLARPAEADKALAPGVAGLAAGQPGAAEMARFTPAWPRSSIPLRCPKTSWTQHGRPNGGTLGGVDVVATTYGMLLRQSWTLKRP